MTNIAVLGTGFGKTHIELYSGMENVNLKIVFGRNEKTLSAISEKYAVKTTSSYTDVLEDPDIDLVDICLPTELHKDYAIKALNSGKNVFCETPVSFSSQDASEIQKAAHANGKKVFVDLFTKFSAPHKIGIEYAKEGKLGLVKHFYAYNKTSNVWGGLALHKSLFTFFIHNVDMLAEVFGKPTTTHAFGVDQTDKSIIVANYGFKNAMATLISDSSLPNHSPFLIGYDIIGDKGSIRFNASFGESAEQHLVYNDGQKNHSVEIPNTDDYEEVLKHVLSCLEENEQSKKIDISHAITVLEILEKTNDKLIQY